MSFQGLQLRFIRFLATVKKPVEFWLRPGVNILCGSSDTGKTFLVEALDFMLGGGDALRDIPERIGYDRIQLGILGPDGGQYTIERSAQGGNYLLFRGFLNAPGDPRGAQKLNAKHSHKNARNLSRFLLQQIGLDERVVLYSKESGETKSLGFRALAHLCLITADQISKASSPIESTQFLEKTREYAVFKLLLTGTDDSAIVAAEESPARSASLRRDALEEVLTAYQEELDVLTASPDELEAQETRLDETIGRVQSSLQDMQTRLDDATRRRKEAWERYSSLGCRRDEINELQARFSLLEDHYDTDLKRLRAIQESGEFFVLLPPASCPLCGAPPERQEHTAVCDGNVDSVIQAANAEIRKIDLLKRDLAETITGLRKERNEIVLEHDRLAETLKSFQQQIDAAVSPEFAKIRTTYAELIDKRAEVRQARALYRRALDTRTKIQQLKAKAPEADDEGVPTVEQGLPKSVLDEFAKTVERILQAWHFPNATNVYFDETKRDLVIGGKLRGSRGRGLCAITHAAFSLALLEFCRAKDLPHPGFVILDSPLLAFRAPQGDDVTVLGTDLKERFYEHLLKFVGQEQIFVVENTEPPGDVISQAHYESFTGNPNIGRYGLFPPVKKMEADSEEHEEDARKDI